MLDKWQILSPTLALSAHTHTHIHISECSLDNRKYRFEVTTQEINCSKVFYAIWKAGQSLQNSPQFVSFLISTESIDKFLYYRNTIKEFLHMMSEQLIYYIIQSYIFGEISSYKSLYQNIISFTRYKMNYIKRNDKILSKSWQILMQ